MSSLLSVPPPAFYDVRTERAVMALTDSERRFAYVLVRVACAASRIHLARSSPVFHVLDRLMHAAKLHSNTHKTHYITFRNWCMLLVASGGVDKHDDAISRTIVTSFVPTFTDDDEELDDALRRRTEMEAEARRVCAAWIAQTEDIATISLLRSYSSSWGRIHWDVCHGATYFDMTVSIAAPSGVLLPIAMCGRHGLFREHRNGRLAHVPPARPNQYMASRFDDSLGMLLDVVSPKLTIISDIDDALSTVAPHCSLAAHLKQLMCAVEEGRALNEWVGHMGLVAVQRLLMVVTLQHAFDVCDDSLQRQAHQLLCEFTDTTTTEKKIASLPALHSVSTVMKRLDQLAAAVEDVETSPSSSHDLVVVRGEVMRLLPEWITEFEEPVDGSATAEQVWRVERPSSEWSSVLEYYNMSRTYPEK